MFHKGVDFGCVESESERREGAGGGPIPEEPDVGEVGLGISLGLFWYRVIRRSLVSYRAVMWPLPGPSRACLRHLSFGGALPMVA